MKMDHPASIRQLGSAELDLISGGQLVQIGDNVCRGGSLFDIFRNTCTGEIIYIFLGSCGR